MLLSVVMPVHAGTNVHHLERALQSICEQTLLPDEIVLVEDGPLSGAHYAVIRAHSEARTQPKLVSVRLEVNRGAGVANHAGLERASGTWIAKMDADDVCMPTRFETQMKVLQEEPVDVLGSYMAEFSYSEDAITGLRTVPLTHPAITRRMRINNPMNHPSVVFSKQLALEVGGYKDMRFMQDYDLFARLLVAGARMANIPEPLVKFRADPQMFRRRRAWKVIPYEVVLQRALVEYGVVSRFRGIANLVARSAFRMLPGPSLQWMYRLLFVSRVGEVHA